MGQASASVAISVDLPVVRPAVFDGIRRSGMRVQMYGMFQRCSSISNVSAQIAHHLLDRIGGVALQSYTGTPFFNGALERHAGVDRRAPIALFYGLPDTVPSFLFDHETTIGGFVCETDRIPDRWVRKCNRFDLVIVPSRFCRDAFRRSGVETPIAVVPHGLEPEYRPALGVAREERFVFYDVVNTMCLSRKGLPELLRCFVRAFERRTDVVLQLRCGLSDSLRRLLDEIRPGPLVEVVTSAELPTAEFAALYSRVHCTVHAAKGEGFGLIPFQSIACETPVIAASSTGMADYLSDDNAMLLRTTDEREPGEVYYRCGSYARLDEDHLVELLRRAHASWATEVEKISRIASEFRERHAWRNALRAFLDLMQDLCESSDPAERREQIRAACG
jgi:glycosyltransferase involved in cell wall biosynthesis